jgi:hypothetical protein
MTKDKIISAIAKCNKEIEFWAEEESCAREEMYAAESMIEACETELEKLQEMLDKMGDE